MLGYAMVKMEFSNLTQFILRVNQSNLPQLTVTIYYRHHLSIYIVFLSCSHNNHTAQYQHPVHSGAPPPYGDESRKRIPPSRSHSHRNSQIHRLRNPTSSLPRRSKSLKDTPTITVQEEDGPHQVITHDHQLSTVTYVPPSPYQIAGNYYIIK